MITSSQIGVTIFSYKRYYAIYDNGKKKKIPEFSPAEEESYLFGSSNYDDSSKVLYSIDLNTEEGIPNGKTAIFGHTPTEYYQDDIPLKIWHGGDKIGIDCGAGKTHSSCRLACLRLDDMAEFYSEY